MLYVSRSRFAGTTKPCSAFVDISRQYIASTILEVDSAFELCTWCENCRIGIVVDEALSWTSTAKTLCSNSTLQKQVVIKDVQRNAPTADLWESAAEDWRGHCRQRRKQSRVLLHLTPHLISGIWKKIVTTWNCANIREARQAILPHLLSKCQREQRN